jgi:chromosome segregation ATPase
MADVKIRVIGEDQATRTLQGIDKELGGVADQINKFGAGTAKLAGTIVGVGAAMKATFDLGEQGAQVLQTAESFDLLLNKIGAAPDLLEKLRAASNGTISDMQLMSSTATLLAGTQGDLAMQLADATPRLLEIAKAANKLNPSLGDTAYMYESIATGVKRASPLILDNLGLTIRIEEANQKYANSLGKTAEELTSEEQKLALLNATLQAGDTLIQQVGGTTDSQTDAFQRLDAATENLTNKIKSALAPGLADVVEALNLLIAGSDQLVAASQSHEAEIAKTSATWEAYAAEMERTFRVQGYMVKVEEDAIRVYKNTGSWVTEVTDKFNLKTKAVFEAVRAGAAEADMQERLRAITVDATAATNAQTEAEEKRAEAFKKTAQALSTMALGAGLDGKIFESLEAYQTKTAEIAVENAALTEEIKRLVGEGVDPAGAEIQKLTEQYNANVKAQEDLRESTGKATKELIFQKVSVHMSEAAALALARQMGLLNEQEYKVFSTLAQLTQEADTNRDGIVELEEATGKYNDTVTALAASLAPAGVNLEKFNTSLEDNATAAKLAAAENQRLASMQAALDAGLSGRLTTSMEQYHQTVNAATASSEELVQKYRELEAAGGDNADQLREINRQIEENNQKQREAQETLRKATAEMIYQRAASGLGADAALVLARGLGLVSETDYQLITSMEALKAKFDENRDGMISAAEGALQYTDALIKLYNAQQLFTGGEQISTTTPATSGYQGDGIYTGGPGVWIGPGPLSGQPSGNTVNVTYNHTNRGISFSDEYDLRRMLAPTIKDVLAGR